MNSVLPKGYAAREKISGEDECTREKGEKKFVIIQNFTLRINKFLPVVPQPVVDNATIYTHKCSVIHLPRHLPTGKVHNFSPVVFRSVWYLTV
jgi:hypothetical protein